MKVRVRLFGHLAERAGKSELDVVVTGNTVQDVVAAVSVAAPLLQIDRSIRFAVNVDYAEPSALVREEDIVSLIPPVGGG